MVNENIVRYRINPYIQEFTFQMILDMLVLAAILVVLIFANFSLLICVAVATGYFVIVLIFHYRVVIQAIIDKRKEAYITEFVIIKSFKDEYSFAGDRFGHSYISFFYPKDMNVCKYKIKVIDNNGEEKKLRTVMSFKRLLEFMVLDKQQIEYLQVTYLKSSRILLHIDLIEEPIHFTSKRKKVIEKAIDAINVSI